MSRPLNQYLRPEFRNDLTGKIELPNNIRPIYDHANEGEFTFGIAEEDMRVDITTLDQPQMADMASGAEWWGVQVEFRFYTRQNQEDDHPDTDAEKTLAQESVAFPDASTAAAVINYTLRSMDQGESIDFLVREVNRARVVNHAAVYWGAELCEDLTSPRVIDSTLLSENFAVSRQSFLDAEDANMMGALYQLCYLVEEANAGNGIPFSDDMWGYIPDGLAYSLSRNTSGDFVLTTRELENYPVPSSVTDKLRTVGVESMLTPRGRAALETASSFPPGHRFDPDMISVQEELSPKTDSPGTSVPSEEPDMSRTVQQPSGGVTDAAAILNDRDLWGEVAGSFKGDELAALTSILEDAGVDSDVLNQAWQDWHRATPDSKHIVNPDGSEVFLERGGDPMPDQVMAFGAPVPVAENNSEPQAEFSVTDQVYQAPDTGMVGVTVTESVTYALQFDPDQLPEGYPIEDDPDNIIDQAIADATSENIGVVAVNDRDTIFHTEPTSSSLGYRTDNNPMTNTGGPVSETSSNHSAASSPLPASIFKHGVSDQLRAGETAGTSSAPLGDVQGAPADMNTDNTNGPTA